MPLAIGLETLVWLDRCQRRIWLDQHGDQQLGVPPARDAVLRTAANRARAEQVVGNSSAALVAAGTWEARVAATAALVERGETLIGFGALEATAGNITLRGEPHVLRRTPDPAVRSGAAYQPIDVRLHAEPTRWDRLRIDALRWLVGATLGGGRTPAGELWLGRADSSQSFTRRSDATRAGPKLAERYGAVLAGPAPPIWFDSDHCPFCPWRDACDAVALEQRDLATLPGLRRSHARALRSHGVRSVAELAALPLARLAELPDSDRRVAGRLHTGAEALLAGRPVLHGRFATANTERTEQERIERSENALVAPKTPSVSSVPSVAETSDLIFLDVETDPWSRVPWAIGWMTSSGAMHVALVAPATARRQFRLAGAHLTLVRSPAHAWQLAARATSGRALHWGDAENLLLARTARRRTQRALGPRLLDMHAVVSETVALPIARQGTRRSGSLKAVAGWLGYGWPAGADHWSDGWEAYRTWRSASRRRLRSTAPVSALAPALRYLRADLEALAVVWGWYTAWVRNGGP